MSFLDTIPLGFVTKAISQSESKMSSIQARHIILENYNKSKRISNRLDKATKNPQTLLEELRMVLAFGSSEHDDSFNFIFREKKEWKIEKRKYGNWRLHPNSKPKRIFQVFKKTPEGPVELPALIGISPTTGLNPRKGFTPFFSHKIRFKEKNPRFATVSGYVANDKHPLIIAEQGRSLRSRIEYEFITLLHKAGFAGAQSSILFNARNNPSEGIRLGLTDLYARFLTVLVANGGAINMAKRARARKFKRYDLMKESSTNATVWIVYLNKDLVYKGSVPKMNFKPLLGPEDFQAEKMFVDKSVPKKLRAEILKLFYNKVLDFTVSSWKKKPMKQSHRYPAEVWYRVIAALEGKVKKARKDKEDSIKKLRAQLHPAYSQKQQPQAVQRKQIQEPSTNQAPVRANEPSGGKILNLQNYQRKIA
jgi:hypothetical protein